MLSIWLGCLSGGVEEVWGKCLSVFFNVIGRFGGGLSDALWGNWNKMLAGG